MDRTLKIVAAVFIIFAAGCVALLFSSSQTPATGAEGIPGVSGNGNVTVFILYGEECPHCHNIMPFIQNLTRKYPQVNFQILETWHNETNAALSTAMNDQLGVPQGRRGVPEAIIAGNRTILSGERDIPAQLESAILVALKKNP
jgi:hypothetical protein